MLCVANNQCKEYGQHQQSSLRALVSIVREDKMNTIQSWKEVIELHHAELIKDYPEVLWVDPGEVDYDSKESS
jgi:hypothetical protein